MASKGIISSLCIATLFLMVVSILAYQLQQNTTDTSKTYDSKTARTFTKVMIAGGLLGMLSSLGSGYAAMQGMAGL